EYVNIFWAKKNAQYETLHAAYVGKQVQSAISVEVDKAVLAKKRKSSQEEGSRKKEEKRKVERRYVLDFLEINAVKITTLTVHELSYKSMSVKERVAFSAITITNQAKLAQHKLSSNSYTLIKQWKKAIENKDEIFLQQPAPTNKEEMTVANALSTLFLFDKDSMRRTAKNIKFKQNQSEIDFIIKFASILVQNAFSTSNDISIDWDITSFSLIGEVSNDYLAARTDITIICSEGVELGCGEVKPPKKSKELINIDRARIAEVCKRQLHLRLQSSVDTKEYCTFGILLAGMNCLFENKHLC
ncbi:hypothetical protein EDC94DRAFT_516012, partial [Helicostylum pulchrum]